MAMNNRGVTAVALVIPSLYALYAWYRGRIQQQDDDDMLDIGVSSSDGPVSIVSTARIELRGDTHVRFRAPSHQTLPEPPSSHRMTSPPPSSVLYTSRGDVTVNVLDDNFVSSEARDYFAEVTDVAVEHFHDQDHVTLHRADFDAMMGFVAKHLRDIPPSVVTSTRSHSIAPGTSLEAMLSTLATEDQANTPLSQIILLVDDTDLESIHSNSSNESVYRASPPPESSAAREMMRSFQASRGAPTQSRAAAPSCRKEEPLNPMPPMTTLVPVVVHPSPAMKRRAAKNAKPKSPPSSTPRGVWESLFGKTAFQNNADLDQSYFVFH